MESCPTQAVLPLVGLAAEKVIRDRYKTGTEAGAGKPKPSETRENGPWYTRDLRFRTKPGKLRLRFVSGRESSQSRLPRMPGSSSAHLSARLAAP
ncbi:MAG: hypothetical protein ACQESR_02185 [Planctomycetota bacterium]